jgi:hypothetical protein
MVDFKVNEKVDTSLSENAYIPVGSLITKAMPPSALANYATDEQCISAGHVPCDGRALSRTTYQNLWNVFGTTFTGASTENDNDQVSGLSGMVSGIHVGWGIAGTNIPSGARILSVTNSTTVKISDFANGTSTGRANIAISPYGFTGAGNTTTFNVPNLRSSRRYIYGVATASGGVYVPSFSANTVNAVTHTHSVNAITTQNLIANNTSGTHTHTVGYTMADANAGHSHFWAANLPGLVATNAVGGTLTKGDGTGTAAGAAHGHSTGAFYAATNSGESNILHGHTGAATSDTYTEATHTHSFTGSNASIPASSAIDMPHVNVLYFIKI